jgi:hypothetical protein
MIYSLEYKILNDFSIKYAVAGKYTSGFWGMSSDAVEKGLLITKL